MDFEINNSLKQRFAVSPRLAAEPGSGLVKGSRCVSVTLWELEGKVWPQRAFGRVRGAQWLEFILTGEEISGICLSLAHLGVPVKSRL